MARLTLNLLICIALLTWLPGCTAEPSISTSGEAECKTWANARCALDKQCAPWTFAQAWGSETTCSARRYATCLRRVGLADSGLQPSNVAACAAAVSKITCDVASLADTLPDCQAPAGKRANAAACGDDGQCASGYCRTAGNVCGTCANRAAKGAPCNEDRDCQDDMACVATASIKKCAERVAVGYACNASEPCIAPASCVAGKCASPLGNGAACTPADKRCDAAQGLFCHGQTNVCTAYTTANSGEACGYFDGAFIACASGFTCKVVSQGQGSCARVADVGEGCSVSDTVPCRAGLVCDGGVCGFATPSGCK